MKESRRDTTRFRRALAVARRQVLRELGREDLVKPATFKEGSPAHRKIAPGTTTAREVFATRISTEARAGLDAEAARVSAIIGQPVGSRYVARIFLERAFGRPPEAIPTEEYEAHAEAQEEERVRLARVAEERRLEDENEAARAALPPPPMDPADVAMLAERRRALAEERERQRVLARRFRPCGCYRRGRHRRDCLEGLGGYEDDKEGRKIAEAG